MKYVLLVVSLLSLSFAGMAHNHGGDAKTDKSMAQQVVVEAAWARETFSMARSGAAYLTLSNPSEHDVTLVSASVDASLASKVELHTTKMQDGMMRMQELEQGITIAAGKSVMLQPGGMHVMLMGLEKPLSAGESFELALQFADESLYTSVVTVQDMSNKGSGSAHDHDAEHEPSDAHKHHH